MKKNKKEKIVRSFDINKLDELISRAALLEEFRSLCGPQTGDGWDNMGVHNLIMRQKTVDYVFADQSVTAILSDLIKRLYMTPGCEVGGPLHIVLDDYNVEDENITWCLRNIDNPEFEEYSEEVEKLCYKIGGLLLIIPEEERLELVSNAWVYANDAMIKERNRDNELE